MDFQPYKKKYYVEPTPKQQFEFDGLQGAVLFIEDYSAAVDFYQQVLGPPAYVEGENTKGWQLGDTWLTLFPAKHGNPTNMELNIVMKTAKEADRLQQAFVDAGAQGSEAHDTIMYVPIHACPVTDPFGVSILIYSRIEMK